MSGAALSIGGAIVGGMKIANPPAPFKTADPVVSGDGSLNGALTVTTTATFKGPMRQIRQMWEANEVPTGITADSYPKSANDAGKWLRLVTYAEGVGGSAIAYSAAILISPPLSLPSGLLPEGQAGSAYSFMLAASGGTAPYSYALSATAPGLTLNSATGVVSGTPSAVGTTAYTVTVTDATGATFSVSSSHRISTTPVGAITDLAVLSIGANSVTVSFTVPANATGFEYQVNGSGSWVSIAATGVPATAQITGLTAATAYSVNFRGKNAYGNGAASNTVIFTTQAGGVTIGLAYTPPYKPFFILRATRALLLADLGLTAGDVITATDYAGFELALDAANAAQKPLLVGIDNGSYTFTATRARNYQDVWIFGYGATAPKITGSGTGSNRLSAYLCPRANDIGVWGMEFEGFIATHMYATATNPLARPDQTGYSALTTPAKREPYHTSNDKMVQASQAAIDNGFGVLAVGHLAVSGSPTISSLKPVRFGSDGGAGGTRLPYNYKVGGIFIYDDTTTSTDNAFYAALDQSPPELLAAPVVNATASSIVAAINANSAASGFSAQIDPRTGKVVILQDVEWRGNISVNGTAITINSTSRGTLAVGKTICCIANSTSYAFKIKSGSGTSWVADAAPSSAISNAAASACTTWARPLDWTIASTGGSVTKDAVGPAVNLSFCKITGCDRQLWGIGDQTALGRIDVHANVLRQTWSSVGLNYLGWTEFWSANTDWGQCLLSDAPYPGSGRTSGNAQTGASNQDGTLYWIGSNNTLCMRFQKVRGTKVQVAGWEAKNIDGYVNVDTITSAGATDFRLCYDKSVSKCDDHVIESLYIYNVRNLLGAIDSQLFYFKGDSFTFRNIIADGFGARRKYGSRSIGTQVGQGSEGSFVVGKNNDRDGDPNGVVFLDRIFINRAPNGIPIIKFETKAGRIGYGRLHIKGWKAQLDDGYYGDANGRALRLWEGTGSASGTVFTPTSPTDGPRMVGMRLVIGTTSMHLKSGPNYAITGSAANVSMRAASADNGWTGTAALSGNVVTIGSTTSGAVAIGMAITIGTTTVTLASGPTFTLASSVASAVSGAAFADLINTQDGAIIRHYDMLRSIQGYSCFWENIDLQGGLVVPVLVHQPTASGGTFSEFEFSNDIWQNDGSADYPEHTGDILAYHINATVSGIGSPTAAKVGRNPVLSKSGVQVGRAGMRYNNVMYYDNDNTQAKPYEAFP